MWLKTTTTKENRSHGKKHMQGLEGNGSPCRVRVPIPTRQTGKPPIHEVLEKLKETCLNSSDYS